MHKSLILKESSEHSQAAASSLCPHKLLIYNSILNFRQIQSISYNRHGNLANTGDIMAFEQLLDEASHENHAANVLKIDVKNIASTVLARIVEEVKNDELSTSMAYDRVHNRHNR